MVKCQSALFCYRTYCYLGHIIFCIAWRVYLSQWYCKWVSAAVRCSCSAGTTQGTAALFLFYSLSTFSDFSFMFVFLTVLFLFLGASFVCVNNLKRHPRKDCQEWQTHKKKKWKRTIVSKKGKSCSSPMWFKHSMSIKMQRIPINNTTVHKIKPNVALNSSRIRNVGKKTV